MIATSHLLASLAVAACLDVFGIEMNFLMIAVAVLTGLAHDVDGFFVNNLTDHHEGILHAPLTWVIVSLFTFLAGYPNMAVVAGVSGLFHIFSDYVTALTVGVKLFYPFSDRMYSLYEVKREFGEFNPCNPSIQELKKYFGLYWKKKPVLIYEVSLNLAGLASLFFLF